MTHTNGAEPVPDEATNSGRPAGRRWPLLAAIALAVVAALILAVELTIVMNERAATTAAAASDAVAAAPVPLSSQPFSFLDRPVPVPDLKFVDGSARSVSLSDFKGRPVLLNIWATWCMPCRKEMPSLDRLQAKFDPSKFLVLTLSIDRAGLPTIRKFYANLGLKSLGIYADQAGAALHQLGLIGIPGTLLIDTDGREIGRKLGPAEWDSPEVVALLRSHFGLDAAKATGGNSP
jgi:thiol-disulfide isomerase/thioredoxin